MSRRPPTRFALRRGSSRRPAGHESGRLERCRLGTNVPALVVLVLVVVAAAGCGKKGPPLAPLRIAPGAVTGLEARRVGDRVTVRFTLPERNDDNSTPADVARVDVYALSVRQAADAPPGPEFAREAARIGSATPKAGETTASVSETLGPDALKFFEPARPAGTPPSIAPAAGAAGPPAAKATSALEKDTPAKETPAQAAAAKETALKEDDEAPEAGDQPAAAQEAAPVPVRVYMAVPVNAKGRRGVGATVAVPLVEPPAAPGTPLATYDETAIELTWVAPEAESLSFNVYEVTGEQARAGDAGAGLPPSPLNATPLAEASFEDARLAFGTTRCYRVTAVTTAGALRLESAPSPAACVTPVDTFPPPAPAGVSAVAGPGTISLIWDAVERPDLAGYLVLRGDAAGGTLQALTPEPIKETTFRDAAVQPGARYVYAVVAVDTAKNLSAQSARVEETAR